MTAPGQDQNASNFGMITSMGDSLRRTQRLASLLEQLAEEDGAYGAKSRAAKRLGISQGYASKIVSGLRANVSDEVIRQAAQALDLRDEYFDAPGPIDLDYHPFVGSTVEAWDSWIEGEGASATDDEREVLRAMASAAKDRGEVITPSLLSGMLLALRMSRAAATKRG